MYSLIKALLFRLDPERAHDVVMGTLAALSRSRPALQALRAGRPVASASPVSFMNLAAPNGLGLAAGLDKHARAYPALRALGFGWIEVGTVTPRPQTGNPRPRLFRLDEDRALVNRMGFNSCGVDVFVRNLASRRAHYDSVLGINIGKNADTPLDSARDDYLLAFQKVYPHADYVAVNVSSPNTESLRDLQHADRLRSLIDGLLEERERLRRREGRLVPIAVKLSPDLSGNELKPICELLRDRSIDAVIATNTTTTRPRELESRYRNERGGLSGAPLEALATEMVEALHAHLGAGIPLIGVGGVEDVHTAARKIAAGACAVQCYTAFVYQGPALARRIMTGSWSAGAARPVAPAQR